MSKETRRTTLVDLRSRRGPASTGGNPHVFMELHGATMVEVTAFEPDPVTYRNEFYYNSILNRLFRRIVTAKRPDGVIKAQWVSASD